MADGASSPARGPLGELEHLLKVDERVIRYIIQRQKPFAALPNTYSVARQAKRALEART